MNNLADTAWQEGRGEWEIKEVQETARPAENR